MELVADQSAEIEALAGTIFDAYAESLLTRQATAEDRCRAVATASIVAFFEAEKSWYEVLDQELAQRGINSRFSTLDFGKRYYLRIAADHQVGQIGKKCRSVPELLGQLTQRA